VRLTLVTAIWVQARGSPLSALSLVSQAARVRARAERTAKERLMGDLGAGCAAVAGLSVRTPGEKQGACQGGELRENVVMDVGFVEVARR
jgi:hypothetical protein